MDNIVPPVREPIWYQSSRFCMDGVCGIGYNQYMSATATVLQPRPFVESRHILRHPMTSPVRFGWINDDKRMEYSEGKGIDMGESGLAISSSQRLRLSALLHLEVAEMGLVTIGRVRNCIRWGKEWRTGIEFVG